MKLLFSLVFILLLTSCVTFRVIGKLPVNGVVIDAVTKRPLADAELVLIHEAVTFKNGSTSKILGKTKTDEAGLFFIPENNTIIKGGVGGFSGYIMENPTLRVYKKGFCGKHLTIHDDHYQNLVIELKQDANCI